MEVLESRKNKGEEENGRRSSEPLSDTRKVVEFPHGGHHGSVMVLIQARIFLS